MLIGQYHTKISSKGRTAIPAKFRKELGKSVILSRWYENCLSLFSKDSWERIINLAVGESLLTRPARETERFLLGSAFEQELDDQGRLVVPQPLRYYSKLKDEVVFVGIRDRVEVWSKDLWEKKEQEITQVAEELIEEVQKKGRREGKESA